MSTELDSIRSRIRGILLADWDPTNASRNESAHGEYDSDIDPLLGLIHAGAGEDAVVDYLYDREREIMCFPGLGKQRLRRAAQKLVGLRQSPVAEHSNNDAGAAGRGCGPSVAPLREELGPFNR